MLDHAKTVRGLAAAAAVFICLAFGKTPAQAQQNSAPAVIGTADASAGSPAPAHSVSPAATSGSTVLFNYTDSQTPPNWTGTGDFPQPKFSEVRKMVTGEDITGTQAPYLISTRSEGKRDNQEVGTITSEAFQIPPGSALIFKHAGGNDPQNLRLSLLDSAGKELKAVTGNGSYNFVPVIWNGADVTGKDVRVRLSDGSKGSYGFVAASDFQLVSRTELASLFVPGRQEQLSLAMSQLKVKDSVPGIWAATWDARIGDVSASYYDGYSSVEQKRKATSDTLIQYGSISKVITGILTCIMVHKIDPKTGKPYLRWDETINDVLPDLRSAAGAHPELMNATVEQLITCTAGLGSFPSDGSLDRLTANVKDPSVCRRIYCEHEISAEPVGKPGEKQVYASGCEIVGAMLEKRTGEPLERLMKDEIFVPFGLNSCQLGEPNRENPDSDTQWGYDVEHGSFKLVTGHQDVGTMLWGLLACGGIYGNTEDLAKLFGCLYTGARQGYGSIPKEAFTDAFTAPVDQPGRFTRSGFETLSNGTFCFSGAYRRGKATIYLNVNNGSVAVVAGNLIHDSEFLPDARAACLAVIK